MPALWLMSNRWGTHPSAAVHTTEDVNRCVDAFIEIGKSKGVIHWIRCRGGQAASPSPDPGDASGSTFVCVCCVCAVHVTGNWCICVYIDFLLQPNNITWECKSAKVRFTSVGVYTFEMSSAPTGATISGLVTFFHTQLHLCETTGRVTNAPISGQLLCSHPVLLHGYQHTAMLPAKLHNKEGVSVVWGRASEKSGD